MALSIASLLAEFVKRLKLRLSQCSNVTAWFSTPQLISGGTRNQPMKIKSILCVVAAISFAGQPAFARNAHGHGLNRILAT